MTTASRALATLLAISLLAAPAATAKKRTHDPLTLTFVPQESTGTDYPVLRDEITATPLAVLFEDARPVEAPTVVGQGQRDDDSTYPVHSVHPPGDFAGTIFLRHARGWGLSVSEEADLLLHVRLVRFFVRESDKAVGSMYMGEVRVAATLQGRDRVQRWEGTAFGDARRYGKSDSHQNRNEVLSDAMLEAYSNLLGDRGLQGALLPPEPPGDPPPARAGAAAPPPADGNTPAGLLREVLLLRGQELGDDLLLDFIRQHEPVTPFTAEDLLAWREAGLPDEVIAAGMRRSRDRP